jgi:hypothetical protein
LTPQSKSGCASARLSTVTRWRSILQTTLKEAERPTARNLYERIRARLEPLGGADDLELPPRLPDRDPPRFD